jgi:DNA mismatch endonuclease, patch repair protein
VDELSPEHRSENMRRIRGTDTTPELLIRRDDPRFGFRIGFTFANFWRHPIVFTRLKSIVEVRGCLWHQHGRCADSHVPKTRRDYWVPKLERNAFGTAKMRQR